MAWTDSGGYHRRNAIAAAAPLARH
jgi:hypothetical protein